MHAMLRAALRPRPAARRRPRGMLRLSDIHININMPYARARRAARRRGGAAGRRPRGAACCMLQAELGLRYNMQTRRRVRTTHERAGRVCARTYYVCIECSRTQGRDVSVARAEIHRGAAPARPGRQ